MEFLRVGFRVIGLVCMLMALVATPVLAASSAQAAADPVTPDFASTAFIGAVPLMFVVIGLTQWLKKLKDENGEQMITGNALLVTSMCVGGVFGLIYMMTKTRPPVSSDWYLHFVYWSAAVVYGISIGLLASGIYDAFQPKQQS